MPRLALCQSKNPGTNSGKLWLPRQKLACSKTHKSASLGQPLVHDLGDCKQLTESLSRYMVHTPTSLCIVLTCIKNSAVLFLDHRHRHSSLQPLPSCRPPLTPKDPLWTKAAHNALCSCRSVCTDQRGLSANARPRVEHPLPPHQAASAVSTSLSATPCEIVDASGPTTAPRLRKGER